MKTRLLAPILLASLALTACGGDDEADTDSGATGSDTSADETQEAEGNSEPADSHEGLVELETEAFTVLFPEEYQESAPETAGMETTAYTAQDGETMAVVAWTANPSGVEIPPESVLEGNITGAGGSLGDVTDLEIDGWPAQETASEIGGGNGATWVTVVVTDDGILQVQYAARGGADVADVPAIYEEMRDSIQITS